MFYPPGLFMICSIRGFSCPFSFPFLFFIFVSHFLFYSLFLFFIFLRAILLYPMIPMIITNKFITYKTLTVEGLFKF